MAIKYMQMHKNWQVPIDFLCNRVNDGNNFVFHAKDEVRYICNLVRSINLLVLVC